MIAQNFSHHSALALYQNESFNRFCGTAEFWIQQMYTASDTLVLVREAVIYVLVEFVR